LAASPSYPRQPRTIPLADGAVKTIRARTGAVLGMRLVSVQTPAPSSPAGFLPCTDTGNPNVAAGGEV